MNLPKFGSIEEETVKPDGTVTSEETVYGNGQEQSKYRHYKYRIRVNNPREEMTEFLRFSEETAKAIKSSFHKEGLKDYVTKGYYDVVKEWTEKL